MSWSGFKKNVGRATTQVMMKTGHVEKTSDREYEVEERRFRTLESASLKLQKEAKGYLDSLRAMTASQMRIAETIDAFYGDSGARDGVSRSYKQAVEDLDAETIKALDGPYRCVPTQLHKYAWNEKEGKTDTLLLRFIEWQMNEGRKGTKTARIYANYKQFEKLMDYVYRTTVLEPINRFCAYFPDINECIKKRNHKMLDYDALRSKVKKLTEKPDKDASKLPRAEKECEMVSVNNFSAKHNSSGAAKATAYPPILAPRQPMQRAATYNVSTGDDEFDMPSPPKIFAKVDRTGVDRSCSQPAMPGPVPFRALSRLSHERDLQCQPSEAERLRLGNAWFASTQRTPSKRHSLFGLSPSSSRHSVSSSGNSISRSKRSSSPTVRRSAASGTPFFNPSELEDIMRPVREDFMKKQADNLAQAKAAYDQLNEQLSTELPQLIDLRVPYLDPSFEALVKIQLRFCAEAYSRMAQVQQYLDASTRDQYASGELDAKVEDVLGQIRELSIAGTV